MLNTLTKFLSLNRRKSSKIVCFNEIEQPEGKAGSQASAGSVEAPQADNTDSSSPDQRIHRDLTKSLSYDYHETHKIDDIYIGKHRPLVGIHYQIDETNEEQFCDHTDPVQFQLSELLEIKHLSDGSTSTIFEASVEQFGKMRSVIVKTIRVDDCDVPNSVSNFLFERDLLLSLRSVTPAVCLTSSDLLLSHPNVVTLLGHAMDETCGDSINRPVLIFENLAGGSLGEMLTRRNLLSRYPLPFLRSLQILRDISSAIKYLHRDYDKEIMILHRDLKPDNIWYAFLRPILQFCAHTHSPL
jgi:hypothetical protein